MNFLRDSSFEGNSGFTEDDTDPASSNPNFFRWNGGGRPADDPREWSTSFHQVGDDAYYDGLIDGIEGSGYMTFFAGTSSTPGSFLNPGNEGGVSQDLTDPLEGGESYVFRFSAFAWDESSREALDPPNEPVFIVIWGNETPGVQGTAGLQPAGAVELGRIEVNWNDARELEEYAIPFTVPAGTNYANFSISVDRGSDTDLEAVIIDGARLLCFGSDVRIATDMGAIAAGELAIGDLVRTVDAGHQPVRWIGKRRITAQHMAKNPKLRPIRIQAGALGCGLPERDTLISPQHRVLVRGKVADRMFGSYEVLVAARQLTPMDGIDVAHDVETVTYVHFLLDDHQIVIAEGAHLESMYTGPESLKALTEEQRKEVLTLFPELEGLDEDSLPFSARPIPKGRRARNMVIRLRRKNKALLEMQ